MKKNNKELISFCIRSIFAGILIGMAGIAYLLCTVKLNSPILGSVLFSFALLMIFVMELKLFTGVIALVPETPLRKMWVLPISFLGNLAGVLLIALLVHGSALDAQIAPAAETLVNTKLANGLQSAFLTAIICGICISFSMIAGREAMAKKIQPAIFVAFPVVIFVMCGFEHSIADLAYFLFAKAAISWKVIWFFLLVILGNILGGPLILLTKKFSDWAKKDDTTSDTK